MGETDQAVVKATERIDWRKLLLPSLLVMVIPTIAAILVDKWLGTFPLLTIVAILICFPTATIWVTRVAMQEMDRVIAAVAPPKPPASLEVESGRPIEADFSPELDAGAEVSPT